MRYAKFILPLLLLAAVDAHAQMTIRQPEPASNSIRSFSTRDLLRQEFETQITAANKRIDELATQLQQTTDALTAVTTRLTQTEELLGRTHACAAEGRTFNGSICVDMGFSSPVFSGGGSTPSSNAFVAPESYTPQSDTAAPISTIPPTLEELIPPEEPVTIGGSLPAEADLDAILNSTPAGQ